MMMEVTYKPLTVEQAFYLILEDSDRKDLFFEMGGKNNPSELLNLNTYKLDVTFFNERIWFQREAKEQPHE